MGGVGSSGYDFGHVTPQKNKDVGKSDSSC